MSVVSDMLAKYNDPENYDQYVGWMTGLNNVNQNKSYVSSNAIVFEKYAKKQIYNCGHMLSNTMLYYIKQEPDFDTWYMEHTRDHHHTGY